MDHHSVAKHRPQGLDVLCKTTKFSRREIQMMYRGFKQECPTGIVNEDTFKQIYSQFFPEGNASRYAHYVFKAFDHNRNGAISFQEILNCLSSLSRGTLQDKLRWVFDLYDINNDGFITKDEMLSIVFSIYDLMERYAVPTLDDKTARDHVDRIFQKLDRNRDGILTIDEFMEACLNDETISHSLQHLDTYF